MKVTNTSSVKYHLDRIEQTWFKKPWYGKGLFNLIDSISAKKANHRVKGQKTIHELALHILVWHGFVKHKLRNEIEF